MFFKWKKYNVLHKYRMIFKLAYKKNNGFLKLVLWIVIFYWIKQHKIFFWCSIISFLSTSNTFLWYINFVLLTWNTFSCNINTFLSTPYYFLRNAKLFVSTQNYFSCNTEFLFWTSFRIFCHGDILLLDYFYCHVATNI